MAKSTVPLYLRIPPELAQALEEYAKEVNQSMTSVAKTALEEYLEKRGKIDVDKSPQKN